MNTTAKMIGSMLKENTGSHMLDSGGAYGRNWEKNQKRHFSKEPSTTMEINNNDILITHNLYHWLNEQVNYSSEWTAKFNRFAKKPENKDSYWMELMESFAHKYGEDVHTVNTYNGEDLLSQTIQYTGFTSDCECIYLIQIHNGCDVRGGYTAPKAFIGDEHALSRNADASIWCQNESKQITLDGQESASHYWTTDDAYHFYYQGTAGYGAGKQLEDYDRKSISDRHDWQQGLLCYFEDGSALCPKCGSDLKASF
jgi:hypothetical protein